jgi:hypothetical protein
MMMEIISCQAFSRQICRALSALLREILEGRISTGTHAKSNFFDENWNVIFNCTMIVSIGSRQLGVTAAHRHGAIVNYPSFSCFFLRGEIYVWCGGSCAYTVTARQSMTKIGLALFRTASPMSP